VFIDAIGAAEGTFHNIRDGVSPTVAQYAVTHAHYRRVVSKLNLRECYHLFKLRTSPMAHESIRVPMQEALRLVTEKHPKLFRQLQLRD
jgi:thymidylate synthase ThyX